MNSNLFELGLIAVLTVFSGLVLRAYLIAHSAYKQLQKERLEVEFRARQRAVELVEQARTKAQEIIVKATAEAVGEKRDVASDLQKVAAEQQEVYKQMIQSISKDFESEAVREFQELKTNLNQQSEKFNNELATKLQDDYKKAQIELESYKQGKLREIKNGLAEVMIDVSRNISGQLMSPEAHMELAEKMLTEAKQKHGL